MKKKLSPRFLFLSLLLTLGGLTSALHAQNQSLQSDRGQDAYDFCKALYYQAINSKDELIRTQGLQRLIPRLRSYYKEFPQHPNTPGAVFYLAESNYHLGKLNEAFALYIHVIKHYPQSPFVALCSNRLAYEAVHAKQYLKAASYFHLVSLRAPQEKDRIRAIYQEASCYRYADKPNKAIDLYLRITQQTNALPLYVDNANLLLGRLYLSLEKTDSAARHFSKLLSSQTDPQIRLEACYQLGIHALENGNMPQAQSFLSQVIQSSPNPWQGNGQTALMKTFYAQKKDQEVLATLKLGDFKTDKAIQVVKYLIAGRSAYRLKRYNEAITFFSSVERLVPLTEDAFHAGYYRLLCFYGIEGINIPEQVDAFLELYATTYPNTPHIHKALLMKAETLLEQKKYREASATFNRVDPALIGEKNQANFLFKKGYALSLSGDHNGAIRSFNLFLESYPEDARNTLALAHRGQSKAAIGQDASAIKDFEALVNKDPQSPLTSIALQRLAHIYVTQKDYPHIISSYTKLLDSFPQLPKATQAQANFQMAWAFYKTEQYKKVTPLAQRASQLEEATYGQKASLLMLLSSYAQKEKKAVEGIVETLGKQDAYDKIPKNIFLWLGMQCFNAGEMSKSYRYLTLGVNHNDPRQTLGAYWKMLGKAAVETGHYKETLEATGNFLSVADKDYWKAEALLDAATAHLALENSNQALENAQKALKMHPEGLLNAQLRLLLGDIAYNQEKYDEAASYYVVVAQLFAKGEEKVLLSQALLKSYRALDKKGDLKEALHYKQSIQKEFPEIYKKTFKEKDSL